MNGLTISLARTYYLYANIFTIKRKFTKYFIESCDLGCRSTCLFQISYERCSDLKDITNIVSVFLCTVRA